MTILSPSVSSQKILIVSTDNPTKKKESKSSLSGGVHCAAPDGFSLIATVHSLEIWQSLSWISVISHQQCVSSYFLSLSKKTSSITVTLQRCVWTPIGWSNWNSNTAAAVWSTIIFGRCFWESTWSLSAVGPSFCRLWRVLGVTNTYGLYRPTGDANICSL